MNHRFYDVAGNEFRVYSAVSGNRETDGYNISREVAGEVVHDLAKVYMEQAKEKNYSKAVHAVLEKDPALKAAYVGIELTNKL